MKKIAIHLICIFSLGLVFSPFGFATPPNAQIDYTNNGGGDYNFSIDQCPSNVTSAFWILGDGHFRTGLNVNHKMKSPSTEVYAYLLSPYIITPPIKLTCGGCTTNDTSTQPNYQVSMGQSQFVKVGTSWNPTRGEKHYTILTFENITNLPLEGSIRIAFQNNVQTLKVDTIENNEDWYGNLVVDNTDKEITFNFTGLDVGEQRHLLIDTKLYNNVVGSDLNYQVIMMSKKGETLYVNYPSSKINKYPHDPNNKVVSETEICAYNNEEINLEYRIDFQNIGDEYAINVFIEDYLPNHLDYTSFQFISSSFPCQVNQNNDFIEFVFDEIDLAGLDQVLPYIPHPNETKGHVIFSINTQACLDEMAIENEATVYFDGLDSIVTTMAVTDVIYDDVCFYNNISCDVDPSDDGGGTGEGDPPPMGFVNAGTGFEAYPNPFLDLFSIDFELVNTNASESPQLSIYNIQGIKIKDLSDQIYNEKGKQHLNIDASNWSNGIYFIKLEDTNEIHTWKIVKM